MYTYTTINKKLKYILLSLKSYLIIEFVCSQIKIDSKNIWTILSAGLAAYFKNFHGSAVDLFLQEPQDDM